MKNYMMFALMLCLSSVLFCSCSTIGAKMAGDASGRAAAITYTKIAENQSQEFRDQVAALWREVNSLEKIEDLITKVDELSAAFDKVIESEELTAEEKAVLISIKNLVFTEVKKVIESKLIPDAEAVEYLVYFRKGCNDMLDLLNRVNAAEAAK